MSEEQIEQKNERPEIWTRDFILICVTNLFLFMGFQMTLPTLPLFVQELGGSDQLIGLVVGIFTFSALILRDRKSTRLNSSHVSISYAVFCLKKKNIYNSLY